MRTRRERLAYLAGMFDGEGCVRFHLAAKDRGRERLCGGIDIAVGNTEPSLLVPFQAEFGGLIRQAVVYGGNRRSFFQWALFGENAAEALNALMPFLIAKRPQAVLALKIRATSPGRRRDLIVQLKALKRVDHGGRFAATQTT